MRMRPCLLLVFTWLCCALANPKQKSCSDCVLFKNCDVARELLAKHDSESDAAITEAFCGRDSVTNSVKVCCSELRQSEQSITQNSRIAIDTVEDHPNLSLLKESCGKTNGDKIVGGHAAGLYQFPWMVLIALESRGYETFKCAGSLINERYVLTAAHCVRNKKVVSVRVGEHDIDSSTDCQGKYPRLICESHIQNVEVESALYHPEYDRNKHDIALLRLKESVDLNHDNVGTICLPVTIDLQSRNIDRESAAVAGWGITEAGYSSSKLLTVDIPIHTTDSCGDYLIRHRGLKSFEDLIVICAGAVGKDTCSKDSGGPLMIKGTYKNLGERYIQYGVVSSGPVRCGSGEPGIYADVTQDLKWILDNIRA